MPGAFQGSGVPVPAVSVTGRRRHVAALAAVCLFSAMLNLVGIRTGLPSRERLEVTLGGPEGVDAVERELREIFASGEGDRSDFVATEDKLRLVRLSPYLDQLRTYHPDEQYTMKVLARMARERDPLPGSYFYGSGYIYQVGIALGTARLLGLLPSGTDPLAYVRDPDRMGRVYLVGRVACTLFVTGTVAVVFLAGLRLGGLPLALVASLLLGGMPLVVLVAKFVKPDAPALFWSTLVLLPSLSIARRGGRVDYLLAGVCVGIAAATKHPAGLSGFLVLGMHLVRRRREGEEGGWGLRRGDRRLLTSGAAALAAFLVLSPAAILDAGRFWHDFAWNVGELRGGGVLANLVGGTIAFGKDAFGYRMGPAAAIAALAGLAYGLARPKGEWGGLLPAVGVWILFATQGRPGSDAYLVPAYPLLALLAARVLLALPSPRASAVAAVAAIAVTTSWAWAYNRVASGENVRLTAARWIRSEIPPGASIGMWQYPVAYRVPGVDTRRYRIRSMDLDPDATEAAWFVDSSMDWSPLDGWDRLRGRRRIPPLPDGYETVRVFERVPRALFGAVPLHRDRALGGYLEVVAPRVRIGRRPADASPVPGGR